MKSIITTLLFLTGFCIISCNQKQSPRLILTANTVKPSADSTVQFSWKVAGCADKNGSTKSIAGNKDPGLPEGQPGIGPDIKVAGDSVVYTHVVDHLCCRQVTVSAKRDEQVLTFTEHWFGKGCKCRCSSTVSGVIQGLPKGGYRLYILETGTDPVNDTPVKGADTLINTSITIR